MPVQPQVVICCQGRPQLKSHVRVRASLEHETERHRSTRKSQVGSSPSTVQTPRPLPFPPIYNPDGPFGLSATDKNTHIAHKLTASQRKLSYTRAALSRHLEYTPYRVLPNRQAYYLLVQTHARANPAALIHNTKHYANKCHGR